MRLVGLGLGGGIPLPVGEGSVMGLCPLSENFVEFSPENGAFWCVLMQVFLS